MTYEEEAGRQLNVVDDVAYNADARPSWALYAAITKAVVFALLHIAEAIRSK